MVLLRMYSTEWIGKSSRKYGNGQDADIRRNEKDGTVHLTIIPGKVKTIKL